MQPDRIPPECQCAEIATRYGRLPNAGITVEDRVRDFRTDPAAAVFPHYEKLGHVPIYGKTAVRVVVNQHETREISAQPYEQRNALLVVPVRFEIRIFRKQPVVAQFASLHVRPLFREVVDIELHQVLYDMCLGWKRLEDLEVAHQ